MNCYTQAKKVTLHSPDRLVILLALTHFCQLTFSDTKISHFQKCKARILGDENILNLTSSLTRHNSNSRTESIDMSDPDIKKENIEVMEEQVKEMKAL